MFEHSTQSNGISLFQIVWVISTTRKDKEDGTECECGNLLSVDVAEGRMNGAPNETRTHSQSFESQAG